jgi:molecular chaperone HtpG
MYRASGQAVPVGKRILELNPDHPLVTGLQQAHKAGGDDAQMRRLVETAELLYGTALLAEGDIPKDPAKFAGLLADRLARTV